MEFFTLSNDFLMMFIRLLINVVFTWLIIDRLYYRKCRRRDFYFTFMLISVAIFFIVFFMIFVLEDLKGKTSMGVGIGLFGIFSIMRYRTDAMPVREMTYLFVIIALSLVNAVSPMPSSHWQYGSASSTSRPVPRDSCSTTASNSSPLSAAPSSLPTSRSVLASRWSRSISALSTSSAIWP